MKFSQCIISLSRALNSSNFDTLVQYYLEKASVSSKWMLFSDYCLDDKNKPNDVITFVMLPYCSEDQYSSMDKKIQQTQPKDIKKVSEVNGDFLEYIKGQPILSFSFIVNNRKVLFGTSGEERCKNVVKFLETVKDQFVVWRANSSAEMPIDYYQDAIKKLKKQIVEAEQTRNVKQLIDIILVATLGAHFSSNILKKIPQLDVFGWFPDRDKIGASCDNIVTSIFYTIQYNQLKNKQYQFVTAVPNQEQSPFYDNMNRIADVICGTLADYKYNTDTDNFSKDKFAKVLKGLIADNSFIKIYRLIAEGEKSLSEIEFKTAVGE